MRKTIDRTDRDGIMEAAAEYLQQDLKRGPVFTDPEAARTFAQAKLRFKKHEVFACLFLDTRHRLIDYEEVFTGTIDGATVYPRVVAEKCLQNNAAALIVAHNHPSGVSEPSLADQAITKRIKESLALLDIRLLDHLVVGDMVVSMAQRGMI